MSNRYADIVSDAERVMEPVLAAAAIVAQNARLTNQYAEAMREATVWRDALTLASRWDPTSDHYDVLVGSIFAAACRELPIRPDLTPVPSLTDEQKAAADSECERLNKIITGLGSLVSADVATDEDLAVLDQAEGIVQAWNAAYPKASTTDGASKTFVVSFPDGTKQTKVGKSMRAIGTSLDLNRLSGWTDACAQVRSGSTEVTFDGHTVTIR